MTEAIDPMQYIAKGGAWGSPAMVTVFTRVTFQELVLVRSTLVDSWLNS